MSASAVLVIIGALAIAAYFLKEPIKIGEISIPVLPNSTARNSALVLGLIFILAGVVLAFRETSPTSPTTNINLFVPSPAPISTSVVTETVVSSPSPLPEPTLTIVATDSATPSPSTSPVVGEYKALFYLHAPQDFWSTGNHAYLIEFRCTTNIEASFAGNNGNAVIFNVRERNLLTTPSFFLRHDSVYDSMTNGNPISVVSKSSPSYATVVITRFTYNEAQKVLDECNASISVDGFQSVNLDEYERPVLDLQEIDLESLPIMSFFP